MSYHPMKRTLVRRHGALAGFGDFTDSDQCSQIPIGDPYRKPGNYCATPDGGTTTFNADGSTYRAPGIAVDPDPAHPAGSSSGAGGILNAILGAIRPKSPPFAVPPTPVSHGPSTTTLIAVGAGAVVLVLALASRRQEPGR